MKSKWRKSSYSTAQGNCVEVAGDISRVLVRDTTDQTSPMLRFTPDAWRRLVNQVKRDVSLGFRPLEGYPGHWGAPLCVLTAYLGLRGNA
jgi:hypothetical protein